jgi:hypothetical protein
LISFSQQNYWCIRKRTAISSLLHTDSLCSCSHSPLLRTVEPCQTMALFRDDDEANQYSSPELYMHSMSTLRLVFYSISFVDLRIICGNITCITNEIPSGICTLKFEGSTVMTIRLSAFRYDEVSASHDAERTKRQSRLNLL